MSRSNLILCIQIHVRALYYISRHLIHLLWWQTFGYTLLCVYTNPVVQ